MPESKEKVRVRFAPSPTGLLHIGGARSALFNYLFAKKHEGEFILRIDDTDEERSKDEYEEDILKSLKWLGLEWDEIYHQNERLDLYEKYINKLLEQDKVYRCFCSKENLKAQREYFRSIGKPPVYNKECRDLTSEEIQEKIDRGEEHIIRFKTPFKRVSFKGAVRGEIEFDTANIGDFSIAKSLREPLYNFATVIDEHEMNISHVIRGEEHISNTPAQILIYEALDWETPEFAHLPLILSQDKSKMSKRDGDVAVTDYREKGYLPEAIINFVAFLGWNPGTQKEVYSMKELIRDFSLDRVRSSGSVFDFDKLKDINGHYIRELPLEKLVERVELFVEIGESKLEFAISLYQKRAETLSEFSELLSFFTEEDIDYDKELLIWKDQTKDEVRLSLDKSSRILSGVEKNEWNKDKLAEELLDESKKFGEELRGKGDRGYLLWPLRVALTGQKASAGPFEVAELLGKERSLKRINKAKS